MGTERAKLSTLAKYFVYVNYSIYYATERLVSTVNIERHLLG